MASRPNKTRRKVVVTEGDIAPATEPSQLDLISAIEFIAQVQSLTGNELETHCAIGYKWAVAFNGLVAIAHPITDELFARPHTLNFLASLKRAGGTLSITQQQEQSLTMQSGRYKALIQCASYKTWPNVAPDPLQYPCDNRIKDALATVGVLANESGQTVVEATILLRNGSAVATNRHVMFEFWHGCSMPTVVLPKIASAMVTKTKKNLVGIGASAASVTFHFEGGAWLRTQQYSEPWPDTDKVFNNLAEAGKPLVPVPEQLYEGVAAMKGFGDESRVYFLPGAIASHDERDAGASYEIPDLPGRYIVNPRYLALTQPWAKQMSFDTNAFAFYGDAIRGLISLVHD